MHDTSRCILLVCGADDGFARPLAVTLYSALVNLEEGWSVELYLIDGGICPENKRRIERVLQQTGTPFTLHWTRIERDQLADLPVVSGYLNESTYLRLFIPDIVPKTWSRALYLDSDIVVERSLVALWQEPFEGTAAVAVQASGIPNLSHPWGIQNYRALGLNPNSLYFSAGVLVLNLKRWREENIGGQAIQCALQNREYANYCDQYALNVVLAEDWRPVDARWNVLRTRSDLDTMPESPQKTAIIQAGSDVFYGAYIYHFAGLRNKPWASDCTHAARPRWTAYLWASGWYTPGEQVKARAALGWARLGFHVRYRTRTLRHRLARQVPGADRWLRRKSF